MDFYKTQGSYEIRISFQNAKKILKGKVITTQDLESCGIYSHSNPKIKYLSIFPDYAISEESEIVFKTNESLYINEDIASLMMAGYGYVENIKKNFMHLDFFGDLEVQWSDESSNSYNICSIYMNIGEAKKKVGVILSSDDGSGLVQITDSRVVLNTDDGIENLGKILKEAKNRINKRMEEDSIDPSHTSDS